MTVSNTPAGWRDARCAWVNEIVRNVAELGDRTSPDDWPEAMLVTAEELTVILESALAATPASPQAPAPSAATATALEQERAKFQQETRRTSELSRLLKRWIDRHEAEHGPGPWAKSCEVCALVGESNALLARPINDPAPSAAPHQGADALREALIVEMRAQIQHLVDDLCDSTIDDFGLQRYVPKQTLMFHNMVAALVRWSESAALAQHQAPQQTAPQGQEQPR